MRLLGLNSHEITCVVAVRVQPTDFCFSDVPAVQAVHTVGSVPEEDRRSQRHSASGLMMIDSPHEDECTAVGALNPNSSSSLMKADKRCTTCKFLISVILSPDVSGSRL